MRFLFLGLLALVAAQKEGKKCLQDALLEGNAQAMEACALYTDAMNYAEVLAERDACLANKGDGGTGGMDVVFVEYVGVTELVLLKTYKHADLEKAAGDAVLALKGHTMIFKVKDTEHSISVYDDRSLMAALVYGRRINKVLTLKAHRTTENPTNEPTKEPTPAPTNLPTLQPTSFPTLDQKFFRVGTVSGFRLALNIDTRDGNVVHYDNRDFWESSTGLGGATADEKLALTRDYKNRQIFTKTGIDKVMIVVHIEGKVVGWRKWKVNTGLCGAACSLSWFFRGSCSNNQLVEAPRQFTKGTIEKDISKMKLPGKPQDRVIYFEEDLFTNVNNGNPRNRGWGEFNRISQKPNPTFYEDNSGWGLGTHYDAGLDDRNNVRHPCNGQSRRPVCDAQLYCKHCTWSKSMLGGDNICINGCPWTSQSGLEWDYAILVGSSKW